MITTGKSTIEAIERVREAGLRIMKVIALVDRQEGGRAAIEEMGYGVDSIVTREEVMERYKRR